MKITARFLRFSKYDMSRAIPHQWPKCVPLRFQKYTCLVFIIHVVWMSANECWEPVQILPPSEYRVPSNSLITLRLKPFLYIYCRTPRYRYCWYLYSILCQNYIDLSFPADPSTEYWVSLAEQVADWRHPINLVIIQLDSTCTPTPSDSAWASFKLYA